MTNASGVSRSSRLRLARAQESAKAAVIASRRAKTELLFEVWLGPAVGAAVAAASTDRIEGANSAPAAAFIAFAAGAMLARSNRRWAPLLPFISRLWHSAGPFFGLVFLLLLKAIAVLPGIRPGELAVAALATATISLAPMIWRRRRPAPPQRVALIGSARSAAILDRELVRAGIDGYVLVGRAAVPGEPPSGPATVPTIGRLGELRELVARERLDLLVLTAEAPRQAVFREMADTTSVQAVRLWDFVDLSESLFGHVPVTEINAEWFQCVLHPSYRHKDWRAKRAMDLIGVALLSLVALPLLALAATAIRLEGQPVLFRQVRIGRAGRPFTLYKLCTMRTIDHAAAQWAHIDDPRITRVGRIFRRTHLDELPQVFNVLKGEMSLVGPRPEQPEFVARLEENLQFYSRRHFVKPGLTGWAQVRCGYAGSDLGSAWKLCHDLYYLRHRTLALDLLILAETLRSCFVNSHRHDVTRESLAQTVRDVEPPDTGAESPDHYPLEEAPAARSVG